MTTANGNGNGFKKLATSRPLLAGVITAVATALVTALIATSYNDYLNFREQDAIHKLRIEQLRVEAESYRDFIRRELETAIQEGRRENKVLREDLMKRDAGLRRDIEQVRVMISTKHELYFSIMQNLAGHKDNALGRLSALETKMEAKCK